MLNGGVFLGIDFDETAFRNSNNGDYQRTLVASLLKRTGMDITTALEYGRAYLIEGDSSFQESLSLPFLPAPNVSFLFILVCPDDYVILAYVKYLLPLIQPTASKVENPSGSSSSSSSRQVRKGLADMETESLSMFSGALQLHDDYATRIAGIVDDVDNKEKLLVLLRNAMKAISPYDYDCDLPIRSFLLF